MEHTLSYSSIYTYFLSLILFLNLKLSLLTQQRQDYLYGEMLKLEQQFDNIQVSRYRLSTIWGGASLLTILLHCMEQVLLIKSWKWDFVINLSESDYPIKYVYCLSVDLWFGVCCFRVCYCHLLYYDVLLYISVVLCLQKFKILQLLKCFFFLFK